MTRPMTRLAMVVVAAAAIAFYVYRETAQATEGEDSPGRGSVVTIDSPSSVGAGAPGSVAPELDAAAPVEAGRSSATPVGISADTAPGRGGVFEDLSDDRDGPGPREHQVTVRVDSELSDARFEVLIASVDEAAIDTKLSIEGRGGVQTSLPAGSYVFALRDPEQHIGDAVLVEVSGPTAVELLPPLSFTMDMELLDSDSERPVPAGTVRLERIDVPPGIAWRPADLTADSSVDGRQSFRALVSGRWRIVADADGYAEEVLELDLPGAYRDYVSEHGKLDYGPFYLAAEKQAVFELVGADAWTDLTGFKVAYRHDGDQVPFSAGGKATVVLGRHSDPLYMKLWYPDGAEMIFYVMGGAPSSERPHQIRLGDKRSLDVRLELSSDMEDLASRKKAWVRVAFQEKGYEKRSVALPVEGSGVYRCEGVYADDVTISFITMDDTLPVDWQSQWVRMEPSGVTTTTLVVSEKPRRITFIRPDGEPAAGIPFQVYAVPDLTGWTADGRTSSNGTGSITHVEDRELGLFAHAAEQTELLIEVPVDLRAVAPDPRITIGGGEPTYVEAICEGQPIPSVWLDFYGRNTGVYYTSYMTNDQGQTARIKLHPNSRADFALYPCEFWTPATRRPLHQGRNVLPLWRKGRLVVTRPLQLKDVESVEFGTDLKSWRSSGQITVTQGKEGARVCTVPVGEYRWRTAAGEWDSTSVSSSREATTR